MRQAARTGRTAVALCAVLVLAFAASSAQGATSAEQTRESYRAAVEPVCRVNSKANERILKNARRDFKADRLKPTGRKFLKAAAALGKAHKQLRAVPQPPADAGKLGKWLERVKKGSRLFRSAGKALLRGQKGRASRIVVELNRNATAANNLVILFRFDYCRFEPGKYT